MPALVPLPSPLVVEFLLLPEGDALSIAFILADSSVLKTPSLFASKDLERASRLVAPLPLLPPAVLPGLPAPDVAAVPAEAPGELVAGSATAANGRASATAVTKIYFLFIV